MGTLTGGPGAGVLGAGDRVAALAAVKAQLRVETNADDAVIAACVESALGIAEQFVAQVLIVRTMTVRLPARSGWQRLPAGPVRAIAPLPGEGHAVDIDAGATGWVRAAGAVTVTFEAGLAGGWAELPVPVRQGVVVLAAHLFLDRDGLTAVPAAVTALWRPFRAMRLADEVRA